MSSPQTDVFDSTPTGRERLSIDSVERHSAAESFAVAVEAGLQGPRKSLPCRFLYDPLGSQLFEEICDLPEYYPTRTERSILEQHAAHIAGSVSRPVTLVELGSGRAAKTRIFIETFLARDHVLTFVPIDISRSMLETSSNELLDDYPELEIRAIEAEYEPGLQRLEDAKVLDQSSSRLILWLGSSIGNLSRDEAARFLSDVRASMRPCDRLLIGIDLRKDADTLERAYDDAQGVTAAFNLNLLSRINRELGGSFELEDFAHRAVYDERAGRVEMHLVSQRDQRVTIDELDREVHFQANETIHTENSYKYSVAEIDQVAARAGLTLEGRWTDSDDLFSLNLFHHG